MVDGFIELADKLYSVAQEFLDSEKEVKDKAGIS
jgi:hypothetical protein